MKEEVLNISVVNIPGNTIWALEGALDWEGSGILKQHEHSNLAGVNGDLIVDLTGVRFIDSHGIGKLWGILVNHRNQGIKVFFKINEHLKQTFIDTKVLKDFNFI